MEPRPVRWNKVHNRRIKCEEKLRMLTTIDHIVLTASDMNKTISFYCDILGMKLENFTTSGGG